MIARHHVLWLRVVSCVALGPILLSASNPPESDSARKAAENLGAKLARAQLKLAEANLAKVSQTNERTPRSIPADVVAQYQREVELARIHFKLVEAGSALGDFSIWVARAEAAAKAANREWKTGLGVNRQAPGMLDRIDLACLELRAEVARLNLERGRALAGANPQEQLRWQLELLNGEVARLKQQVLRSPPIVPYYPLWPY